MKRLISSLVAAVFAATVGTAAIGTVATAQDQVDAVLKTYADIAQAGYEDSLVTAQDMRKAVQALVVGPSAQTLSAARAAWLASRAPYQQTEAYRFGNAWVDDWEGKVNAWPLDEGLIDYVDASYGTASDENSLYVANVVANPKLTASGKTVDAANIDAKLLETLHEIDGVEANVATGYHAIEFLLWGQDLNGTGPGAGNRPHTDYDAGACTGGNCARRAAYLLAATDLLISDLEDAVAAWSPGGEARAAVEGKGKQGLAAIVTGLGSLSFGELAGERMKLGLLLHDPEEEHDCFSDNTHNSHFYDAMGVRNVYLGHYRRIDGTSVSGPGLTDLVRAKSSALDAEFRANLDQTMVRMYMIKDNAESGRMAYDQMIGEGNRAGNGTVQAAIDALLVQTKSIERVAGALDLGSLEFEGSDSLQNPKAVFK